MSWLRSTSLSLARQLSRSLDPRTDYEPHAFFISFCKHWQQVCDIINKSQTQNIHDDVLAVVNHVEQVCTLLSLEARARDSAHTPAAAPAHAPCLEHLLTHNLLHKLYEWATYTGKYENAVRLEELKLFGCLISNYSSQVIAAEPFLRPLLKLLCGFRNELPPPNLENQLVAVLNQLCVALMQNMKFIDLFFITNHSDKGSTAEFIIVRLLLSSVHREGVTGAAARDALLLCAKMAARSEQLANYMLEGNACVVLATGLSGLYSHLPRVLPERAHRLTPDHVNQVHKLTLFIDSLEFCNAVAQVAHPSIKKHLLDLLSQGFLVPVMGPALLQTKDGPLQSGAAEQSAATAYLELVLRCTTRDGLLAAVLQFLFQYEYDGVKVIDVLLARLEGDSQLSLVSLTLMETLIDLNFEDVMMELVFKYLLTGNHLMANQRCLVTDPQAYRDAALGILQLSPQCCSRPLQTTREWMDELANSGRKVVDYKKGEDNRKVNGLHGDIAMSNLVQETKFNYGNPNETLFGNYHAYLCDARFEIVTRTIACLNWNSKYDTVTSTKKETNNNLTKETKDMESHSATKEPDSLISICTSGYETLKNSDTSEKEPPSLTSLTEPTDEKTNGNIQTSEEKEDSLTSIGESSGYDSFKYRTEECEEEFVEESFKRSLIRVEREFDGEVPVVRSWRANAKTIVGPLLSCLLRKSSALLQYDAVAACQVTGVLSKLAAFPTPLLTSLLLCPSFVLQPNVLSLFQIVSKLRDEIDELTSGLANVGEIVDKARAFLIQREMALVKSRSANTNQEIVSEQSPREASPPRRADHKRRSISSSFSSMFGRRPSASSQHSVIVQNQYNSSPRRLVFTQEAYWDQSVTLRTILNAVILDEWLKELAALCEEHALRLSASNYEDETYMRMVSL